jgi:hypothetical protein
MGKVERKGDKNKKQKKKKNHKKRNPLFFSLYALVFKMNI